ncbi:hypothetical protein Ahy_Scaffold5g107803 isoform A [Arachis hypogaea]|uniref:Uncharacterized protein n=1 Tax=Arachis hypogaea TaxID=3818 RepID=A0A444WQ73_ARAHY|nr:hypothetical protein Ahy_Scaffold5g107803 isoform A [Arachis hypogaea]
MLKQQRQLSMSNNEEVGIRPSKTYKSFVVVVNSHCESSFVEKDVINYITRENHLIGIRMTSDEVWCWGQQVAFISSFMNFSLSRSPLLDRVENHTKERDLLRVKRESDAADFHTGIPCATKSSIEAQF